MLIPCFIYKSNYYNQEGKNPTYPIKKATVSPIEALKETVSTLRGPGGCPWDIEQTHQSLAVCLMDECCELLETLDNLDMEHMLEELGDVLLQVVMHAQIASEQGNFTLEDVAAQVNEKLIRRHPHVFGPKDLGLKDAASVLEKWDEIKASEVRNGKARDNKLFDNLPPVLPALLYARDVFKQIQKMDLDPSETLDVEVIGKNASEVTEDSAGKALFEWVAACRMRGIDPESALRRFSNKVIESFEEGQRN